MRTINRLRLPLAAVILALSPGLACAQNAAVALASERAPAASGHVEPDASKAAKDSATDTAKDPSTGRVRVTPKRVFLDIAHDQAAIWTSPFHLKRADASWLIPAIVGSAAFIASDKEINSRVSRDAGTLRASNRVSDLGSGYALYGTAAAFWLGGVVTHNERAQRTGILAGEALVDQFIVVSLLKAATNRERPNKVTGRGDFWDGGRAFPSGHSAAAWTVAAVVGEEYRDHPWVRWSAYGVASAVSVSRVTGRKHSPSDVVVGGLIGFLIGRHVAHRGILDATSAVTFLPLLDMPTRTVGLSAGIGF